MISYKVDNLEGGVLQMDKWKHVVIDEAHRIKNEDSVFSCMMCKFLSVSTSRF